MDKLSLDGLNFETICLEVDRKILTITLNRPEKKNAMNNVMMDELNYALTYAKQEDAIRVVIIAANGDIFCAGADLSRSESVSNVPKLPNADDISLSLRHLYKPVICKIQGSVLAGALLIVTNSTHAIAVEDATFSAPDINNSKDVKYLNLEVYEEMAFKELSKIENNAAKKWGLINEHVDKINLDKRVQALATELASLAPETMKFGLEAYEKQDSQDFNDALPYLKEQIAKCFEGRDAKEGIAAFLEKRKPNWD